MTTWLDRTGQRRRMLRAVAFSFACLVPVPFASRLARLAEPRFGDVELPVVLALLTLAAVGFVVLVRSVTCPRCETRVIWKYLRTASFARSVLRDFRTLQRCPECGDRADLSASVVVRPT